MSLVPDPRSPCLTADLHILRGVNLDVAAGGTCHVGRSGYRQSTMLNIIGLLDAPVRHLQLDGTVRAPGRGASRSCSLQQDFSRLPAIACFRRRTAAENDRVPLLYASAHSTYRHALDMLERGPGGSRRLTQGDERGEQQRDRPRPRAPPA